MNKKQKAVAKKAGLTALEWISEPENRARAKAIAYRTLDWFKSLLASGEVPKPKPKKRAPKKGTKKKATPK